MASVSVFLPQTTSSSSLGSSKKMKIIESSSCIISSNKKKSKNKLKNKVKLVNNTGSRKSLRNLNTSISSSSSCSSSSSSSPVSKSSLSSLFPLSEILYEQQPEEEEEEEDFTEEEKEENSYLISSASLKAVNSDTQFITETVKEGAEWQFMNDESLWLPMDSEYQLLLPSIISNPKIDLPQSIYSSQDSTYIFDLINNTQKNTLTNRIRSIRCIEKITKLCRLNSHFKQEIDPILSFPKLKAEEKQKGNKKEDKDNDHNQIRLPLKDIENKLRMVETDSEEWKCIESKFLSGPMWTTRNKIPTILTIICYENPLKTALYNFTKQYISLSHPDHPHVNETLLFHGTSTYSVDTVVENGGVDMRYSGSGYFGRGIYLTPDAGYVDENYAVHSSKNVSIINKKGKKRKTYHSNVATILMVRSLVGQYKYYEPGVKDQCMIRAPNGFDSVYGYTQNTSVPMYVIHDNNQLYTNYSITYKV